MILVSWFLSFTVARGFFPHAMPALKQRTNKTTRNSCRKWPGFDHEKRNAHYVCAMVLYYPDGRFYTSLGELHGTITYTPEGENGFGYDPIFFLPSKKMTVAQISQEEKVKISHRTQALKKNIYINLEKCLLRHV